MPAANLTERFVLLLISGLFTSGVALADAFAYPEMTSGPLLDRSAYERVESGHVVYGAAAHVDHGLIPDEALDGLSFYGNDIMIEAVRQSLRTLLSQPHLEQVMRIADLDQKAETNAERRRIVELLRERIRIEYSASDGMVKIYCAQEDAETAKNVTKALLTIFLESSYFDVRRKTMRVQASIDRLIARYEDQLRSLEQDGQTQRIAAKRGVLSRLLLAKEQITVFEELRDLLLQVKVVEPPRFVE